MNEAIKKYLENEDATVDDLLTEYQTSGAISSKTPQKTVAVISPTDEKCKKKKESDDDMEDEDDELEEAEKWIPKDIEKGALSKALGIPEEDNIPVELLNAIIDAETGDTIKNPTKSGKASIEVTTKLQRQANFARNVKTIKK